MGSPRILPRALLVASGLAAILAVAAAHAGERTLYEFRGHRDGSEPGSALISDQAGNLYGVTVSGGGSMDICRFGCGTIFEIAPDGHENVLHAFAGGSDGFGPTGLIGDGAGNFYGTTALGGGSVNCGYGCGTIFELTASGSETALYAFQGGADGWGPVGGLIGDQIGDYYGETSNGGSYNGPICSLEGCGTVFKFKPDGSKLTLYSFQSGNDGDLPWGGMVIDSTGNLYGTTYGGGGSGCNSDGCGTVYKITSDGTESVLYAFQGGSDGAAPVGLVMDGSGNLYGVTEQGGSCSNENDCGTIYELAPDGSKTLLYDFRGSPDDGWAPEAALIMDKAGNLFGTTFGGGGGCKDVGGCGTVFELARSGKETVLRKLKHSQGSNPAAALLLGAHNELYGTAERGGKRNNGAVFEIKK